MGFIRVSKLWKNGIIPYDFEPASAANATYVATVQAAMLEWMNKTEITFVPRTNQSHYVRFRYQPTAGNCNSPVGNEGGQLYLNCWQPDNWGVYVHELGHTVGFIHEHQRPDRNNYVIVDANAAKKDPYNILPEIPGVDILVGDYDCISVNHYPPDDFMKPKNSGCATIGTYDGVSMGDMNTVRTVYGFVPAAGHIHQGSAISRGLNNLDYAARWADNGIYFTNWSGGNWQTWGRLVNNSGLGVSPPTLVSRTADTLDVFIRGTNKGIYHATMQNNKWQGWNRLVNGNGSGLSAVSAVSRKSNKIDIFIRGENNGIYQATMTHNGLKQIWQGWNRIGSGVASSDVAAVARKPENLDLFVLGVDRGIYTAWWHEGLSSWQGWARIGNATAVLGTNIAAIARKPDNLDLFIIGEDQGIYSAAWQAGPHGWQGWWRILDGIVALGTNVTAVSRTPDTIDLFVVGQDYRVWTATWNYNSDGKWRGWNPVLNRKLAKRSNISAVSRSPNHIDLFAVGDDGKSWTAAWENGKWKNWWLVKPGN